MNTPAKSQGVAERECPFRAPPSQLTAADNAGTTIAACFRRWWIVVLFAIAMAWVESAVVYDLRTLVHRIEPYQPNPLPIIGALGPVELVREAATMIMLLAVGTLAGRTWRSRVGYAAVAFGVWDIFYYIFLNRICGWPHSLLDWDILFLLPLPWWGPVLAPVLIALLLIAWGTSATHGPAQRESASRGPWLAWTLTWLGVTLALYVFMADSLRVAGQGIDVIRKVLPMRFDWPLFAVAFLFMSVSVIRLGLNWWSGYSSRSALSRIAE